MAGPGVAGGVLGARLRGRPAGASLPWREATVVAVRPAVRSTTRPVVRLALAVDSWDAHVPGQHVDVRLTADDGYRAQRSYSIASAPRTGQIELLVERVDDGEVSPYLTEIARPGDRLEVRGPIGGHFVWRPQDGGPLQLVAGGSGIAPFLSMLDAHQRADDPPPARVLYSARTLDDVIAGDDLARHARRGVGVTITLTRSAPPGWGGATGRVDGTLLAAATWVPRDGPRVFVCGPSGFVEVVADALVAAGHPPARVRTERFGATGTA